MKFTESFGQTPIDPGETEGLIPQHITLQRELNEFEATNVAKAVRKYLTGKPKTDVSDPLIIKRIHRDMFDDTWAWAGKFRTTVKNLGVFPEKIHTELKRACDDLKYWIENESFSPDETAVRFHHRLVWIHLFPNGNGRHARLVADIFLHSKGIPLFSWGKSDVSWETTRKLYLEALKKADTNDYDELLRLARG